jgi:hypothetical protein
MHVRSVMAMVAMAIINTVREITTIGGLTLHEQLGMQDSVREVVASIAVQHRKQLEAAAASSAQPCGTDDAAADDEGPASLPPSRRVGFAAASTGRAERASRDSLAPCCWWWARIAGAGNPQHPQPLPQPAKLPAALPTVTYA